MNVADFNSVCSNLSDQALIRLGPHKVERSRRVTLQVRCGGGGRGGGARARGPFILGGGVGGGLVPALTMVMSMACPQVCEDDIAVALQDVSLFRRMLEGY